MPFPRHCPNCGVLVSEDAGFCSKCGASLGPSQPTTPSPPQRGFPSSDSQYSSARSTQPYGSSEQLERAWKRAEKLSYAVIGLSVVALLETLYWLGFF